MNKTNAVWLGSRAGSDHRLGTELQINRVTKFKLLGITFDTLAMKEDIFSDNLHEKVQEIKRLGKLYKSNSLSLIAIVAVIKTLMIPKLIHILSVILSYEKAI